MSSKNLKNSEPNRLQGIFARSELAMWVFTSLPIWICLIAVGGLAISHLFTRHPGRVIAYVAQDQVYAEPIFHDFEKRTGIEVRAVYDSEAVKTVGLANRLLAERDHPQCDVFWGNEEMRTRQLAGQGIFRSIDGWSAFGYRSRRLVINTNKLALTAAPRSILELTNAIWRGKVAMAYPQFGTTSTHIQALRLFWGNAKWEAWCNAFVANKPLIVDGNSVVVKMVGQGEALIGLTDSDDIAAGQNDGMPIAALPTSEETLLIPNTVAIMRNAPHPEAAQRLMDYLKGPDVSRKLIEVKALEGATIDVGSPTLHVDWSKLLSQLPATTARLNQIFLR
jgi:iron(III) transport system substrate-binding protein